MPFQFSLVSRWLGRTSTPTAPIVRQPSPSAPSLIPTSTSPASRTPSRPSTPANTTPSPTNNIPFEIHTQGIQETLECVRGGRFPSTLLALHRLYNEAEHRARTRCGEADTILRALAVVRSTAPTPPTVCRPESGQDRYREDSSGEEEDKEKEEEVTTSTGQDKVDRVADASGRTMRMIRATETPPRDGNFPPSPFLNPLEETGWESGSCSSAGITMPGVPLSAPMDEENLDRSPEERSPARSPSDDSEDGQQADIEGLVRLTLDAYHKLSPGSPTSSDTSENSSHDGVFEHDARPAPDLGWYEDSEICSTESIATEWSTEEFMPTEEQRTALIGKAAVVKMARENAEKAIDAQASGQTSLRASAAFSIEQRRTSSQITVYDDDQGRLSPRATSNAGVERHLVGEEEHSPTTSDGGISELLHQYSISDEDNEEGEGYLIPPKAAPLPPTLAQGIHLPPFFPNSPNAQRPLHIIKAGLSLPQSTTHSELQEYIARNATIICYLASHLIPAPNIKTGGHTTDLTEPTLPTKARRRERTRLLQAIRSVYWDAGLINVMLAIVDELATSNQGRQQRTVFRKLRSADAQRKGRLTAAQFHRLDRLGFSPLDVDSMTDTTQVVRQGLAERLIEAAEIGALAMARELDVLGEDGILLELLNSMGDKVSNKEGGQRKSVLGAQSGLRCCVNADEVFDGDGEGQQEDEEDSQLTMSVSSLSSLRTCQDIQEDLQKA